MQCHFPGDDFEDEHGGLARPWRTLKYVARNDPNPLEFDTG